MYLIYIDESGDEGTAPGCTANFVVSALFVPKDEWRTTFEAIQQFRQRLKREKGLYTTKEWHANKFVGGRSKIAPKAIWKYDRCQIFRGTLELLTQMHWLKIINICCQKTKVLKPGEDALSWCFDRLLNRVQRFLQAAEAQSILICDAGKEKKSRRITRRLMRFNPVPSAFGQWRTGERAKNIPITTIIEDPFFRDSSYSYFIQAVDFVAFALLKKEERPTPHVKKYGLHKMFDILEPILCKEAHRADPQGIVRK